MQLTFGDAEGLGKHKQTFCYIFMVEMERSRYCSNCSS